MEWSECQYGYKFVKNKSLWILVNHFDRTNIRFANLVIPHKCSIITPAWIAVLLAILWQTLDGVHYVPIAHHTITIIPVWTAVQAQRSSIQVSLECFFVNYALWDAKLASMDQKQLAWHAQKDTSIIMANAQVDVLLTCMLIQINECVSSVHHLAQLAANRTVLAAQAVLLDIFFSMEPVSQPVQQLIIKVS